MLDYEEAITESFTGSAAAFTLAEETSIWMWTYAGSFVLAVGLLGHGAVCAVTLADRALRERSIAVHIVSSSAAGIAVMLLGLLNNVVLYATRFDVAPRGATSAGGCRLHATLTYFSLQWYSWMQALVAAERLICVQCPTKYRQWCTRRRNACAVAACAACLLALDAVVGFAFGPSSSTAGVDDDGSGGGEQQACAAPVEAGADLLYGVWVWIDMAAYCALPAAVVVACNTRTVLLIYRAKATQGSRLRRVSSITAALLAVNAVFLCSTLPVSLLYVIPLPADASPTPATEPGGGGDATAFDFWYTALNLLQYAGCGLSCVAYFMGVPKFRRALLVAVQCCARCRQGEASRTEGASDSSCGVLTAKTGVRNA